MPYQSNKNMKLGAKDFRKGEEITEEEFAEIPAHRQGALLRTRLIIEVEAVSLPPGDDCPLCDAGPFQRLEQHISMVHGPENVTEEEVEVEVSADPATEESDGNS